MWKDWFDDNFPGESIKCHVWENFPSHYTMHFLNDHDKEKIAKVYSYQWIQYVAYKSVGFGENPMEEKDLRWNLLIWRSQVLLSYKSISQRQLMPT